MQISEDYFLIRLAAIIIPAFALFIGSMVISILIIKRYSRAVKRLYQMNFNGVEMERKRIANDMHDQVGYNIMQVRNALHEASKKDMDPQTLQQVDLAQLLIGDLHFSLRQLIENIYPRELMASNWKESFEHLAKELSLGKKHLEIDIEVDSELNTQQLHQMYRLTQEMLANIFTHTKVERVNLQIYERLDLMELNFTYKNSWVINPMIIGINGRGSFIINERMRLLNASIKKHVEDGYKHEIISFQIQK
jgi:glucose-6-phosphate-specific signal transduction histidine kinase